MRLTLFHLHLESRAVRKIGCAIRESTKMCVLSHEHFPVITLRAAATKIRDLGRVQLPQVSSNPRFVFKNVTTYFFYFFLAVLRTLEHPGRYSKAIVHLVYTHTKFSTEEVTNLFSVSQFHRFCLIKLTRTNIN